MGEFCDVRNIRYQSEYSPCVRAGKQIAAAAKLPVGVRDFGAISGDRANSRDRILVSSWSLPGSLTPPCPVCTASDFETKLIRVSPGLL
jgi:hypothetical protein